MLNLAFWGFRHAHILALYEKAKESPLVNLVGAYEADAETKEKMEKECGVCFTYDSCDALLADPKVDAVAIGDYYGARGKEVIAALKHGKHVIADKPLCTSMEEAKEIRRLSEEKNLTVYLMLDLRFDPSFNTAKKLIEAGEIGEVTQITFGGQHPLLYDSRPSWYFEEGKHGGVINDIAIHGVDIIRYMTGLSVRRTLAARTWNAYAQKCPDFLDSATFMCELENGAGVMADVSYASPDGMRYSMPTYWEFLIWGMDGMIRLGRNLSEIELYKKTNDAVIKLAHTPAPRTMLEDFVACIEGKKDTVLSSKETLDATEATLEIQVKA